MTVMMLVSLSTLVSAQSVAVVGSRKRVNDPSEDWQEPSVAVARFSAHDELVVAAKRLSDSHIAYAISLDGASSFSNGELTWSSAADTVVAVDALTNRLWITALLSGSQNKSIRGAWKDPYDTEYDPASEYDLIEPTTRALDRPTLHVLSNGNYSGRHLVTFIYNVDDLEFPPQTCPQGGWGALSDSPYDIPFQAWDLHRMEPVLSGDNGCKWQGWGATPVELSTGRVVVVVHDYQDLGVWQYNNGLPYVVYSDDGGETWDPDNSVPVLVAAGGGIVPIEDNGVNGGDTPYGIDRHSCAPAIAVDPGTDDVYVAFYARKERDESSGDHNSDIYIAKSVDPNGELSFPSDEHLVQLTDDLLGLESDDIGPDQVMPSIAVDSCGGVNVVFYDNRNDDDRSDGVDKYDVYFARITDYGTENMAIQQAQLSYNSFKLPSGSEFLGDYHHMAMAGPGGGPTLYPAWMGTHIVHNDPDPDVMYQYCFVNKIGILCWAELSSYIEEEESSCELFERLYKDGTIDGDLNGDEVVDTEDEAIFAKLIEEFRN